MRPSALCVVAACAVLPAACSKPEKKAKPEDKAETAVTVAPKKAVPTTALPPLAADPGGATGKPVWQAGFGGLGIDSPRGIAVGADGSVYICGYIEGETDFGGTVGKKKSAGKSDAFVAKLGPDGKIAWAQVFGAAREDSANAIAVRGDKIVVAGVFLDEIKIGSFTKKSSGSDDLFIAAFDKDGNADWLWTGGGIDSDGVNTIAAMPDGGWVIGGSFTDAVDITAGAKSSSMKSKGGTDAILIKLAAGGDTEWVKQFGGRYDDSVMHVAVDANSNIYVQGVFKDIANWGGKDLKAGGGSDNDVVLAKYDVNGDHVWSQRFGNAFNEVAGGVAVDPAGNVTMVGSFENKGSISFGEKDDHVSLGEADVYVARFAGDGKLLWAKTFGGERIDVAYDVAVDTNGNAVVTGWFEGTVDLGKGTVSTKNLNKDVFVTKLNAKGETVWVTTFGDKDHDQGRAIAVDAKGSVYVTGLYRFKLSLLDPPVEQKIDLNDPVLSKAPKPDVFVIKLER
ncbi:MAG TPA: SBBP repeat-containing protein [Kofleriaceae bacterium]